MSVISTILIKTNRLESPIKWKLFSEWLMAKSKSMLKSRDTTFEGDSERLNIKG